MGEAKRKKHARQQVAAGDPATLAGSKAPALEEIPRLNREAVALLAIGEGKRALPLCQAVAAAYPNRAARNLLRMAHSMVLQPDAERRFVPPFAGDNAPVAADHIDIVVFHVDTGQSAIPHAGNTDYAQCLRALAESANLTTPGCRTILLTDERTALPEDLGFERVVRLSLNPALPMYERMRAQGLYLRGREPGRVTAFVDSDVVVNRSLTEVFAGRWEIGVTWRTTKLLDAPLNGGVIFAGHGDGAARFFTQALEQYGRLVASRDMAQYAHSDLRGWYGDQIALAGLVGYREFHSRPPGQWLAVNDVTVKFFPCEQYNFEDAALAGEVNIAEKYILHFKGDLKRHMSRYLSAIRDRPL